MIRMGLSVRLNRLWGIGATGMLIFKHILTGGVSRDVNSNEFSIGLNHRRLEKLRSF